MKPVRDAIALARIEGTTRAIVHLIRSGYRPTPDEWELLAALPVNGGRAAERDSDGYSPAELKWIAAVGMYCALVNAGVDTGEAKAKVESDKALSNKHGKIDPDAFDRVLAGRSDVIPALRAEGLWPFPVRMQGTFPA